MPIPNIPTRTDSIGVKPESLPTPPGKTEKRELRSTNSKTFLHAERAADGKEIRTCEVVNGAVCYQSPDGSLRSIDTTIRDLDGVIGVEWAPYQFRLNSKGIGFSFNSSKGGSVEVELVSIGGDKFDKDVTLTPTIVDNTITFSEVRPGCDIVIKCLNTQVKTIRILKDANAPRTFDWQVSTDKPALLESALWGEDADGNHLELVSSVNGNVATETWTGNVKLKLDANTRIKSLSDKVVYPVQIDPTVNYTMSDTANDGDDQGTTWASNFVRGGNWSGGPPTYSPCWFIQGVAVPQGATITSATFQHYVSAIQGSIGYWYVKAQAIDNASIPSNSNLPKNMSKTTAGSARQARSAGTHTITCTSVIQEIVNRAGWASGNNINLPFTCQTGQRIYFSYFNTFNASTLSITYTSPTVATPSTLALTLTTFAPTVTVAAAPSTGSGPAVYPSAPVKSVITHRRR